MGRLLDQGAANGQVVQGILQSPEYRTLQVRQLYVTLLHREAVRRGLGHFTAACSPAARSRRSRRRTGSADLAARRRDDGRLPWMPCTGTRRVAGSSVRFATHRARRLIVGSVALGRWQQRVRRRGSTWRIGSQGWYDRFLLSGRRTRSGLAHSTGQPCAVGPAEGTILEAHPWLGREILGILDTTRTAPEKEGNSARCPGSRCVRAVRRSPGRLPPLRRARADGILPP